MTDLPATAGHDAERYRTLRRLLNLSYTLTFTRLLAPMMFTLMTNVGRRKSVVALYVIIVLLMVMTFGSLSSTGHPE